MKKRKSGIKTIALSIFIFFTGMTITIGCTNSTSDNSKKEEIVISRLEGDYVKSYNSTKELYKESDMVFKGIVNNTNIIEKNGTVRTLIKFQVKENYKGVNSISNGWINGW
ncbi:MAG: hypothetical protein FD141_263 [Fusobacteria bacterium]|nr:MAG: hypothetical protein FD141_263 [Fusobacteriota bacterium]KAF0229073.1 MAG: hypothetical protein FD182_1329 [Fusobacteriota bacterium]